MFKKKSDVITHEDIAEPGLVTDHLLKELEDVVAYTPVVTAAFKKMAGELEANLKGFSFDGASLSDIKKANTEIEKANKLAIDSAKAKKIQADAEAALAKAEREQVKTSKEKITLEDKKQKQQQASIKLTDKELAQAQLDAQKKKDRIALLKAEIVEMDKTAGSLQRVEAANTRLRIERKNLDTTTIEGRRRLIELNEEINRNNKYIVENSDKLKQQKLNVGNYTDSIKKAFEGTGLLGERIAEYLNVITLFADKLEGIGEVMRSNTLATEANTAITETNTVATAASAEAESAVTASTEANTIATEANTEVTEANAAAQGNLLKSLKALATNPYVLSVAAVAGFTKVLYDNLTALDENRDKLDAFIDGAKAFVSTIDVLGVDSYAYAKASRNLRLELEKLNDEQIDNIVNNQTLRTEAAKARESAAEEGRTIAERVDLLDQYISKNKEATQGQIDLAQKRAEIQKQFAIDAAIAGKELTDEQRKEVFDSIAAYQALIEQQASETLKAQKQQVALRKQYQDEVEKMVAESNQREIEIIDTYAKYKVEGLKKNQAKTLKEIELNNKQELDALIKHQEELGVVDANGIDHTKEFMDARNSIIAKGKEQEKELNRTTILEIEKLQDEANRKRLEAEKKFRDDMQKIQRGIDEVTNQTSKAKEDGQAAELQSQIEFNQDQLNEVKKSNKYTFGEYKQFYKILFDLQTEYYDLKEKQIKEASDFEKQKEADRLNDAEKAIRDKYFAEKKATDQAIRDSEKDQKKADEKIKKEDTDREKRKNAEIEAERKRSAVNLESIDQNRTNQEAENNRKRTKSARDTNRQLSDDARKAYEEILKQEKQLIDQGLDALSKGLAKRAELQQAAYDKEIDFQKRNLDIQAKLAAEGKANSLAEAQAAIDQAEERKLQAQKRAERAQQSIAIAKAFTDTLNQALQKDEPFLKAFGEAAAAAGLTEAFLAKLISGSALEGTEDTGDAEGRGLDGKGGKLFMVHPNERILTKEQNTAITGMTNEELVANAVAFKKGEVPVFASSSVSSTAANVNSELVNVMREEIRDLRKVIQEKPVQNIQLDGLGEWTETIERKGYIRQVKYRQSSTRQSLRLNG